MKQFIYITLLCILCACGSTRHVSKIDTTTKNNVTTTVTEEARIDTLITVEPDTLIGQKNILDLSTPYVIEDSKQQTTISYDNTTKSIKVRSVVKPQKVEVKMDVKKTTMVVDKTIIKNKEKEVTVKRNGIPKPIIYGSAILVLLGIGFLIYKLKKKV